jgi:hypothetical protein
MPQHTAPQPSLPVGPTASHVSPAPHAELGPHWQDPFTQRSPAPQHSAPHTGPGHPLDAPHEAGFASTPPSRQASPVQMTPSAVHVHVLQLSHAGKTSPSA